MTIDLDCTFPISLADLAIGSSQLLDWIEFLDMINKTKNTNVGNDNLDNDSNEAPGDSEEDDLEGVDETKDKLLDKEWIRGGHQQDLGRSGLSSQDFKSNFSEKIHNS